MTERRDEWDDGRLEAAYRQLAGSAPDGLAERTLAAVRTERPRPRLELPSMRGARSVAALAAVVAILAMIVAGLSMRSQRTASASPSADGVLPVRTVSEALAAEETGEFDNPETLVAIKGWLAPTSAVLGPAHASHPALERDPWSRPYLLTQDRQVVRGPTGDLTPVGPSLVPRQLDGGASIDDALRGAGLYGSDDPVEAVLVGHFHDNRAADCSADQKAACESEFVLDQVPSIAGHALGANVWIGTDAKGDMLRPRMSASEVTAALGQYLGASDSVVSLVAARLLSFYDTIRPPGLVSGSGDDILWFVRVAGPPATFPLDFRGGDSGWFFVRDGTGAVDALGGWGFVPASSPSYRPTAARTFPSGEYVLPTSNQRPVETVCAGVGLDAILHGDPTDPRIAWLENRLPGAAPGSRMEIVWPAGYRARFTPELEIVDDTGTVVLREGAPIEGSCGGDQSGVYLAPPFR